MKKIISTILVVLTLLSTMAFTASAASSESESNDTYSTADTLSLNSTISGKMGTSSDVDFYKITASANGKLTISFKHTYVDNYYVYWKVWVYYFSGGELKELSYKQINGTSNEKIDFPVVGTVSSGVYYVKVSTSYGATCDYSYSITNSFSSTDYYEKELNNSYATATVMSTDKEYGGYMNSTGDSDFYKITAPSNGKLSISFNHTYVDNYYVYWKVWIYYYSGGSYNELSYKQINGTSNEKVDFPTIGTVSSGVYYIKVTTAYDATCEHYYSIKNTFSSTNYYEKEINNSYATATNISLNNAYGGYMNKSDDSDFYKFTLSSNSTITVNFNHTYINDYYVYWKVWVYSYSGGAYTEVAYKQISGSDNESYSLINKQSLSSGTYYLKISTGYDATCNHEYSITVTSPNASTTSYTLSYDANGGSGAPSAQTGSTTYTISSTVPTRSGYTFLGWSKSSSASSASYTGGDKITLSSNTTLYAVWKQNPTTVTTYKLSYDANGGSGAPSAQTGSTTYYVSSTTPTRSGYTFLGWSTSSSASSASYTGGDKISISKNTTLYAVWKENPTTSSDGLIIKTKRVVLDTQEYTTGASTITIDEKYLSSSYTIVATASDDTIINLGASGSSYANSAVIDIYAKKVGECTITVKVMNKAKTVTYEEGTIEVVVRDTYCKTIYAGYKSSYYFEDYFFDGVEIVDAWSDTESVVIVKENRYMHTVGLGVTSVYAVDADGNMQEFRLDVDYDFFDWLIIILLFGWIWYI